MFTIDESKYSKELCDELKIIDAEWTAEALATDEEAPEEDVLDGGNNGPFDALTEKYLKKVRDAIEKYK